MLQNLTLAPSRRTLEFGIYRDGDNNLDRVQSAVIDQAVATSANDSRIEFTVEDTTARHGDRLHTDEFAIAGGTTSHVRTAKAHDMSDERNLAAFVARTLDDAQAARRSANVDRSGRSWGRRRRRSANAATGRAWRCPTSRRRSPTALRCTR